MGFLKAVVRVRSAKLADGFLRENLSARGAKFISARMLMGEAQAHANKNSLG
jgi:hypothetical protein